MKLLLALIFILFYSPLNLAQIGDAHSEQLQPQKVRYFVGLWSQMEESEKAELSRITRIEDETEMFKEVQIVMDVLSQRLLEDREYLKFLVAEQNLTQEIEILDIPANGSFLFIDATEEGITQIEKAALDGELPLYMSELGN
jgi:hypothetical protein